MNLSIISIERILLCRESPLPIATIGRIGTMKNSDNDFALPPFPAFPCVSRYLETGPVADAVGRVSRSILAKEAVSLVIGPPGTGKSLVCSLIADQFHDTHDVVVLGETSLEDESSMLRAMLHRLGVSVGHNDSKRFATDGRATNHRSRFQ